MSWRVFVACDFVKNDGLPLLCRPRPTSQVVSHELLRGFFLQADLFSLLCHTFKRPMIMCIVVVTEMYLFWFYRWWKLIIFFSYQHVLCWIALKSHKFLFTFIIVGKITKDVGYWHSPGLNSMADEFSKRFWIRFPQSLSPGFQRTITHHCLCFRRLLDVKQVRGTTAQNIPE